ncbi:MAG: hypothetical protein A2600_04880 [Candidatus Lambdaproteobacteria bacterium RIFOXYD1_FULL_56_27]|uniref:Uncharacterized protein n=1 Tax=Candidatus Lambdaproteobacteria bacterium RIFOXYD2_FULL_56_26 TaxID=1817773 RepID=A0A1F6H3Z2_9PROT|nr:MAG: hypothetical protein A2426_13945 [Candidatus Lambdaproteobacteria bacterium RIFOXYC1_FULL_56_13]OGH05087.1 MAG: hypothetical protein A2557_08945 [Candidatus Lambdaproteobacteria bacterium RIFOXYD2_FULL_56_26]OGH09552.1 MAG: hypothetical protein A2600_04880 [Candidatus Lambdaproteobacteria bacterium RIFOXYD1_FULL_56_27]
MALEAEVGGSSLVQKDWHRESLLNGRILDHRSDEQSTWAYLSFPWDDQVWSARKETVTLRHFNQNGDLLEQRVVEKITPRFDYKTQNLELGIWRTLEQPQSQSGTYSLGEPEKTQYPLDFFTAKVEKNREFVEFNGGTEMDHALAQDSKISWKVYQWREVALGAYNRNYKGWRLWSRQRLEYYPSAANDKVVPLSGFTYYNNLPVKPNLEAYWKSLKVHLESLAVGDTTGGQVRIESQFSFFLGSSQNLLTYQMTAKSLQTTYDDGGTTTPYRTVGSGFQLVNQFTYQGEVQLFDSPMYLKWLYQYADTPVLSDYRSDWASLSLGVNF